MQRIAGVMAGGNAGVQSGGQHQNSPRETGDGVKVSELIRLLEQDGWGLVRTKGSHRQFKNPRKPGTVMIAGRPSLDVPRGTLNAILKQAGLKRGGVDE
jgi:predicted RNA binding protein YcfA (HicA-like mRNA interferase family)